MQVSDDIYTGPVSPGMNLRPSVTQGPSLMPNGVGPFNRLLIHSVIPIAAAANAICLAQAVATAKNATINGAAVVAQTQGFLNGQTVAVMDTPRGLTMVSTGAGDTTQTVTVSGYDEYGVAMSQVKTLNGVTPVLFTKAFKYVTQVAISAALAGNFTLGTRDAFGLPVFIEDATMLQQVKWNNTLAADAGTLVAGDKTFPATQSTNDVRGLYTPSGGASDGVKRLTMTIAVLHYTAGPTAIPYSTSATVFGAYGVPQA